MRAFRLALFFTGYGKHFFPSGQTRAGSVVVERSHGMREVDGLIHSHVKQKMLKFEVLLLSLVLRT